MMKEMLIGNRKFDVNNNTYVCGILNVTPDSFSDGGSFVCKDKALRHVESMIKDGADIIDVGGESTRPGYVQVSIEEEIERVCHVIETIKNNFDIPVSVDTYKSQVFFYAHKSGADMLNDIWGLKYDKDMAQVLKDSGASVCLMHNKREPVYKGNTKEEFIKNVYDELKESVQLAKKAGIEDNRICIDPGIGFAKTYEMNLWVLDSLREFKKMGYPVYLGASRKSVIGKTLDTEVNDRLYGTIATTVMGVAQGVSFIRVHDIKENVQAIKMARAIIES